MATWGGRAKQIQGKIHPGDLLVFYSSLRDTEKPPGLIYAIIGLYVVDEIVMAKDVPGARGDENAHTRTKDPGDSIIVRARARHSGRLERYLPIGGYRDGAYRIRRDLLKAWGGLSVNDGYVQRSAQLPEFTDAPKFYEWFRAQGVRLLKRNN